MKTSEQIRKAFLDFWTETPRNAKVVPNASLVPNNDSTLLFVNSGMFPLVPYLGGQPHPLGTRLCNVQRCIRTNDIDDVGDNRHLVLFEMIGNWSLGDFSKADQIPWCMELYVEKFGLDPKRLYVSVWGGDDVVPLDQEAIDLWKEAFKKYGVDAEFSPNISDIPASVEEGVEWKYRIFPYGRSDNWWERGHAAGELGGPSSEIFYDLGVKERDQEIYHINDDSGRFVEVGNNVFMEYKLDENLKYIPLEKKNIDFGGGFDRIMFAVQNKNDAFSTDLFEPIIKKIEELSGKKYKSGIEIDKDTKAFRVVAEHARSSTFILADGIVPSSKDQGYILRRLIRRMVRFALDLGIEENFTKMLAEVAIEKMQDSYPHLLENKAKVLEEIEKEEIKFRKTLKQGIKEVEKLFGKRNNSGRFVELSGEEGFGIYETYGFPYEMIIEEWQKLNLDSSFIIPDSWSKQFTEEFNNSKNKHQDQSRAGSEQKFKGGLADSSKETTKLHTTHHLLLAALQKIVDPNIKQKGSNITAERLRIDFNFDKKLTEEEIKKVEDLVNEKIEQGLEVKRLELKREEAEELGAQMEFGQKYPDIVSVYFITDENPPLKRAAAIPSREGKDAIASRGVTNEVPSSWFSAEFCGGPHVSNTSEIGEGGKKFKIQKQESVGAGIKRIKAALV